MSLERTSMLYGMRKSPIISKCCKLLISAILFVLLMLSQSTDAQEIKRHPAAHVIRITASMVFDGKPVEFDELVDCYASYTGTPTSGPWMTFKPSRLRVATEVPGGGMITFIVPRELCYVNGNAWGGAHDKTVPDDWTPALAWFNERNPLKADHGIWYLSETALNAPNGRLKIVRAFRVSVPEHPPSPALLADAERQKVDRDFWLGQEVSFLEGSRLYASLGWMLRIPRTEWENPARAIRSGKVGSQRRSYRRYKPDTTALARALRQHEGSGLIVLGEAREYGGKDAELIVLGLIDGRDSGLVNIGRVGIPKRHSVRYGLLYSEQYIEKHSDNPFFPDFLDEYVPFKCIGGTLVPDLRNPGLLYLRRDRCWHAHRKIRFNFLGTAILEDVLIFNGMHVLDLDNGDLWHLVQPN